MGCDIHMWLEYRRGDGPWRMIKRVECKSCEGAGSMPGRVKGPDDNYEEVEDKCWRCDGKGVDVLDEEKDSYKNAEGVEVDYSRLTGGCCYVGRNYGLFGALAGVRTGEEPLIEPRGIPGDASPEFFKLTEQWDGDAHSTGWLDLDDITAILVAHVPTDHDEYHDLSGFIEQTLPLMQRIAAKQGPKNVRVVFFFDN